MSLPFYEVSRVRPAAAIDALEQVLRGGLDPAADPARGIIDAVHGQLLLMPSQTARYLGIKIAGVRSACPASRRPTWCSTPGRWSPSRCWTGSR